MKRRSSGTFREKIAVSQQYMAQYLGISRPLLSLYEKGLRSLPTEALLKLSALELAFHQLQQVKNKKPAPVHPNQQKHADKTKKMMEQHSATCRYKQKLAQRELDKMVKEHTKLNGLLALLDKLTTAGSKTKTRKFDQLWIEMRKNEAHEKMLLFGNASQAKLQAKIETLDAEAAIYERYHKKL